MTYSSELQTMLKLRCRFYEMPKRVKRTNQVKLLPPTHIWSFVWERSVNCIFFKLALISN